MSNDEAVNHEILRIPGEKKVLLVAPHGHSEDDKNTGKLTCLVAEQMGRYAFINETNRLIN